jgi:hypothetical protein
MESEIGRSQVGDREATKRREWGKLWVEVKFWLPRSPRPSSIHTS